MHIIVILRYRHFRCHEPSTAPSWAHELLSQPGRRILIYSDDGRLGHVGRTVYSVGVADARYRCFGGVDKREGHRRSFGAIISGVLRQSAEIARVAPMVVLSSTTGGRAKFKVEGSMSTVPVR